MPLINLIIAEDHAELRKSLRLVLELFKSEMNVIAEAENGEDLINKVNQHTPDVIITDIQMPVMNGIAATRAIKENYPNIGVIAFSTFNDSYIVEDMVDAGAKGYLLKDTTKEELLHAIKEVYEGRTYYCKEVEEYIN